MISRLHYITQNLPDFSHSQLAEFACKGGADWVQLRVKGKTFDEWLKTAQETKLICQKYGAKLIINDNIQIAKEICADGVHLGKEDADPQEARIFLGDNYIIGGSTNNADDVKRMIVSGVDYIGIGPFRFTSTKANLNPVLGLEGIRKIAEQFATKIPLIAIGGIKVADLDFLLQTGIYGVAVSSAINLTEQKSESASAFLNMIYIQHPKETRTSK